MRSMTNEFVMTVDVNILKTLTFSELDVAYPVALALFDAGRITISRCHSIAAAYYDAKGGANAN